MRFSRDLRLKSFGLGALGLTFSFVSNGSLFAEPSSKLFHLYIYNECDRDVQSTVTYSPLTSTAQESNTTLVQPGSQRLMGVTSIPRFTSAAEAQDKSLVWNPSTIAVTKEEYTHVIECGCSGAKCPDRWPYSTSRQSPSKKQSLKPKGPFNGLGACYYSDVFKKYCVLMSRSDCYNNYNGRGYYVVGWGAGVNCDGIPVRGNSP